MTVNEEELYNAEEKATDNAKCPNCGAELTFNAEKQLLQCEHCGTEVAFEVSKAEEQSFEKLLEPTDSWGDETHVFRCNNCGATAVIAKDEIAKACAFCGTTNIMETSEISGLKPNALVPFKLTTEQAIERVKAWAKKKIFAPKAFKKSATPEEINGVYSPAFTFDTATNSNYYGRLGKRYTTTVRVGKQTITQTRIRYFTVSGSYDKFFDDVLVQSSSKLDQKTVNKLGGFDTNNASNYDKKFLSGYSAEQYSKDGKECWNDAKKQIDKNIRAAILTKYTYDTVDFLNISTGYNNITHKYVLLPVYVGHCNFRQKLYNFFVNGFNGKIAGKAPLQPVKVGLAVLLGLAALGGIAFVVCKYVLGII